VGVWVSSQLPGARLPRRAAPSWQRHGQGDRAGKQYGVSFLTNFRNTVLYAGVTNNLKRRALERQRGEACAVKTRRRDVKRAYFEAGDHAKQAILRNKQIKSWRRRRKEGLIRAFNPQSNDLFVRCGSQRAGAWRLWLPASGQDAGSLFTW
jgi:putative endonuclease